jgi:hypothetical protein
MVMIRAIRKLMTLTAFVTAVSCSVQIMTPERCLQEDAYLLLGSESLKSTTHDIVETVHKIQSNFVANKGYPELEIFNPDDKTLFPLDMASPTFLWKDPHLLSNLWLLTIRFRDSQHAVYVLTDRNEWTPDQNTWEGIKAGSLDKEAIASIVGVSSSESLDIVAISSVKFSTSRDAVGAPIFFQQMPLPFARAKKNPELSVWRLGDISSYGEPPVVMKELPVCANCHSFSRDGKLFGMDIDVNQDKGAYALSKVSSNMVLTSDHFITWSDFNRWDEGKSMGLFSRISPDGKYVASTVKEKSFFAMIPDIEFSQFFFPIRGLIACYRIKERKIFALPGADDPNYVQTCPEWSFDGKYIVFARAGTKGKLEAIVGDKDFFDIEPGERISDLNKKYPFRFDLYRLPFNNGKGGTAEPLPGASHNGKSNYFPKFSPDGKWIVFTQSSNGLAIQPDSKLFILPAGGGIARKMKCNTDTMNSWHSWSPNSRWLVFSSKKNSPYTELFLTHIDENGIDSPPVLISRFSTEKKACIAPEFANLNTVGMKEIKLSNHLKK